MLRRQYILGSLVLALFAGSANAAGTVTFVGKPSNDTSEQLPGVSRAILSPVTLEEADRVIRSRSMPADLNKGVQANSAASAETVSTMSIAGDAAPAAPASIAELARALRNNPDLIYEYVRNNIEYYPVWGVQKGAFGAILDNQGTVFDQAALMVSLLRQAGYTANYVKGRISLTPAQVRDWLGVDTSSACGVGSLLNQGQVPYSMTATVGGQCPITSALTSLKVDHVWVKVNIGGTNYVFDPSFKPHTIKTGINLATATGYNATSYLTTARTGATITADSVQGINRTGIRNTLTTYANNLASYLRTNKPAGQLVDAIGGMSINPHTGGNLRQTTLPYQDTSVAVTDWAEIPAIYRPTLRLQYSGIDRTYTSDAIYGKRLTITYNASNQPVLSLDGVAVVTGNAVTPGSVGDISFTVTHGAYVQTGANQAFTQKIRAGGTFLIGNGWGPAGRGLIEYHRNRLEEARAAGSSDASEVVLGSSLAVLSSTWIAQVNFSDSIIDRIANTNTLFHHQIGIAGYNTAAYVDLPGNMLGIVSQTYDTAKEKAAFFSAAMHSSIMESVSVQQTSGVSAVSTVKLIDIAAINNDKIFDARSSNYASAVQPNLVSCASSLPKFQAAVAAGRRLILPARCNLAEGSWSGEGYYEIETVGDFISIRAAIGGGLAGGFPVSSQTPTLYASNSTDNTVSSFGKLLQSTGEAFGDPIDMSKGSFLYTRNDMSVGSGGFPYSLYFQKMYSSGNRLQAGPLGKGWTHNFAASAKVGSDGFQSMGEDSALDAVATIVEKMVSIDLMTDAAKPLDKMVIATLGQRWFGEQLLSNTVIVQEGLNGAVFVKLPDGSYNAPPGNSSRLIKNADTSYTVESAQRTKLNFNTAGKLASFVHPSGVQVNLTYTGNDLTQVQNSLGRALTLTNTSGRITQVADGNGRTIKYAYNTTTGDLTTFTDAALKNTTFQYDSPGRLTKVFYPSNPTVAFLTNIYDSLGRVQTQTDANAKVYTYYFAGSRSEEVGPGNVSKVSYMDAAGRVLREVNPLGRVTTNTYDGQGRLTRSTLPEGNAVQYTYDDATCASAEKRCTHNIKTVTRIAKVGSGLANLVTTNTYETVFNKIASVTDPRLKVTNYTYTAQGNPLAVTAPPDSAGVRPSTTYGYTAFTVTGFPNFYLPTSQTSKTTSTNSVVTSFSYNAANKYVLQNVTVDSGTGKLNLATGHTYDAIGNLTQVNGPRTDVTDTVAYAYDAERRVIQTTDALGKLSKAAYDADGRLVRSSAQIGTQWLVSCISYTASGKLLKSWGPANTAADTTCPTAAAPVAVKDFAYDDLDRQIRITENLTVAEGGNRVTETAYYLDSKVQNVKRAVGTTLAQTYAAYTYTANGLPSTVKDAKGNLTTYQYDGHDRRLKTLFPDKANGAVSSTTDYEQYGYDNNGNLTSLRRRNAQTVTAVYDDLNRLISRTYPVAADNVNYSYDLLGRLTAANYTDASFTSSYVYDNAGRVTSTTSGGKTLAYQYDPAGNRTRITWPEGGFYVTYAYDALNRLASIKENGTVNLASSYAYDDLSRRATLTLGNLTTTTYGYNSQAGLGSIAHNLAGTAQDVTFSYPRNQAREVASQTWNNDIYQWTGYTNGSRGYTTNGLNQYTVAAGATLGYDANGNLSGDGVWTYGYDLNNRLKSASKTGLAATLAYDVEGRLRQTTIAGVATRLLYDGDKLVAEYDGLGNLLRRYVHGPGVDEALVWYEGTTVTNKNWLYADQLGSVVATANGSGTSTSTLRYGPYGEPNQTTGVRFRYTGQQLLGQLNLYYYKARMYSPELGRFLQTDPIGYVDDMNLYAYAGNNPMNAADPTGLAADWTKGMVLSGSESVGKWWENSKAGFQSESIGDAAMRVLQGLGPAESAIMGAVSIVKGAGAAVKGAGAAEQGGLNLFKFGVDTTTKAGGWKQGDFMLYLPNKGSAQANWSQNAGRLREQMGHGKPIYDSYRDAVTGKQIPTGGFLRAERNLLESRGWQYNPSTGAYHPPRP